MLPLLPSSAYTRNQTFVQQEWDALFASNASTPASTVSSGGWKGVLYANHAIIDPRGAFDFFNQPDFNMTWIDGGATRTWYLAYAAGKELSVLLYFLQPGLTCWFLGLNGGS
jgi:endo-1,3(4)-beta-glucanase